MSEQTFTSPEAALAALRGLYDQEAGRLRAAFTRFSSGETLSDPARGWYPELRVRVEQAIPHPPAQSFGFCDAVGLYRTTITRPDLFSRYLLTQLRELKANHDCTFEVCLSDTRMPIHFAYPDGLHVEGALGQEHLAEFVRLFDAPDLATMDDTHVNGEIDYLGAKIRPLALFTGPRVDYSLHRLKHYTGTRPEDFQNFVLFTNYQFYVDGFQALAQDLVADASNDYVEYVEPAPAHHPPQMPAYHLKRADDEGITLLNIGVGPSNAKTATDHIAVLRPHAWLMLGHCAGLRNTQELGDYVLAHAYLREDKVLDDDLPAWVPIPALAEIQIALEEAVAQETELDGYDLKRIMRTGTVASVDNRNWELREQQGPVQRLSQSRAVALDMESATIAANGFRFRVPYGTLLCVSDKPLHGELKPPGMASDFYNTQVARHLMIGIRAMEHLREMPLERIHSRKLRSFDETAFL